MTKWEYKVVRLYYVDDWGSYLDEAGVEGWELVQILPHSAGVTTGVFKRKVGSNVPIRKKVDTVQEEKRRYVRIPPELNDGESYTVYPVLDLGNGVIGELAKLWAEEGEIGDEVTLEIVEMTKEEFAAIPEW